MESKLEFPQSAILTPYNYFEWKPNIQLHLRSRGLFRITMETEVEPTSAVEKSRYFNRMDEAFGILCFSISPELLFYVESCSTPNQVWKILEELFGKQNEMLKMVEDSIAIYRNCHESFSLEPEDPHVASLYATNYVQGLQPAVYDDNEPLDSISNLREIDMQTNLKIASGKDFFSEKAVRCLGFEFRPSPGDGAPSVASLGEGLRLGSQKSENKEEGPSSSSKGFNLSLLPANTGSDRSTVEDGMSLVRLQEPSNRDEGEPKSELMMLQVELNRMNEENPRVLLSGSTTSSDGGFNSSFMQAAAGSLMSCSPASMATISASAPFPTVTRFKRPRRNDGPYWINPGYSMPKSGINRYISLHKGFDWFSLQLLEGIYQNPLYLPKAQEIMHKPEKGFIRPVLQRSRQISARDRRKARRLYWKIGVLERKVERSMHVLILNHFVQNWQSRALSEVNFVGNSGFLNNRQSDAYSHTLYLPRMTVAPLQIEVLLCNLAALEFVEKKRCTTLTSFLRLMGNFIKTPDDVQTLKKSEVAIAVILGVNFGGTGEGSLSKGFSILIVLLICVYVMAFDWSWGPVAVLVPSEIFPMEIRSAGQSITVTVGLFFTFVIAQAFLAMLCHMKYGLFHFFAGGVAVMTAFVYWLLPETKNVPIEEMGIVWKQHWYWKRFVEDNGTSKIAAAEKVP